MTDYQPINCANYSDHEPTILHRRRLRVSWRRADDLHHLESLLPDEPQTGTGAEYPGASGNTRGVAGYICFAAALLFKWMNRRGHRRSLTWSCFGAVIRPGLPNAGIVHGLYAVPLWNVQAGSRIL